MVDDDERDVIYVATPDNMHHEHALLAPKAGRNVLVEKQMALDLHKRPRWSRSRAGRVFFLRGLWANFLPNFVALQQIFDFGVLGKLKSVHIEYGEYFTRNQRILAPTLAGGPLLGLTYYPILLLPKLLGPAKKNGRAETG